MINKDAVRYRIVGQGLTGSLLALALDAAGAEFCVQSALLPGESTPVAPGIVNPLAGKKFRPPEEVAAMLDALQRAMELAQTKLGGSFWHDLPLLRVFQDPDQAERVASISDQEGRTPFVGEFFEPDHFDYLNDVFGSFLTKGGGWADLPGLKAATASWLRGSGRLEEAVYDVNNDTDAADEVVIFCEGWQIANNPQWAFIPHNPAKGEMLIVRFEGEMPRDRIVNHHCWAQPIEGDLWRIGATYSWSRFNSEGSLKGATDLRERLDLMTPIPYEVLDHVAGVRPIVDDYLPVIGLHPQNGNWVVLNAMGSKGVLQAPLAVEMLVNMLLHNQPVPRAWAVERFFK